MNAATNSSFLIMTVVWAGADCWKQGQFHSGRATKDIIIVGESNGRFEAKAVQGTEQNELQGKKLLKQAQTENNSVCEAKG